MIPAVPEEITPAHLPNGQKGRNPLAGTSKYRQPPAVKKLYPHKLVTPFVIVFSWCTGEWVIYEDASPDVPLWMVVHVLHGAAEGESANLQVALDGDRGSEYVCLLVPRDAFDAPCKLRIDPRLNGEVDPPNRASRPAVSLCSSLPCVMFLNQLALSGRIPVPAIAVSENSFTQPNSAVSQWRK